MLQIGRRDRRGRGPLHGGALPRGEHLDRPVPSRQVPDADLTAEQSVDQPSLAGPAATGHDDREIDPKKLTRRLNLGGNHWRSKRRAIEKGVDKRGERGSHRPSPRFGRTGWDHSSSVSTSCGSSGVAEAARVAREMRCEDTASGGSVAASGSGPVVAADSSALTFLYGSST